ncbi:MAG: response regulator [Planctomycetaceae bacterium]
MLQVNYKLSHRQPARPSGVIGVAGSSVQEESNPEPSPWDVQPVRNTSAQTESPVRIAVAEDERELRDFFSRVLPYLGYDVVAVTSSGEELVQVCCEQQPHVVISDVQLERLSGPEAVAMIRRKWWVAVIYVVENHVEDTIAYQEVDAAVLAKPFRMSELTPAIRQAINLSPDVSRSSNRRLFNGGEE